MSASGRIEQALQPVRVEQGGEPVSLWLEWPSPVPEVYGAAEVLALLMAPVLAHQALPVASALIAMFGSVSAVLAAHHTRLAAVPGLTVAAAQLIGAAHSISVWTARELIQGRELMGSFAQVEAFVRAKLRCKSVEMAFGLFLDCKNQLIRDVQFGEGTVNHVPLYPREVARHAIQLDACALILVHNHPSGDPTPSEADIDMTQQIARALATINVALHDHIIVGDNRIASMRSMRLL